MNEQEPWNFWVLGALRAGRPMQLKDVYADIDGLRGTMSILKGQGLVEHLGKGRTGVYRITSAGLEELHRIEP